MENNNLRNQIEAILAKVEISDGVKGFIAIAQMITAFVLECEADGLAREEAIDLAGTYLSAFAMK